MKRAIYETAARRTVLTIGNFDGVHRGHVEVLRTARVFADREAARLVAVTFTQTPKAALTPGTYAGDLLTLADKEKYLRLQGVDEIIWLTPTVAQMRQSATEFLHMLQNNRHVVGVVVGENFRFGADAQGTVTTLQNYAEDAGWEVISVPLLQDANGVVSSSEIRAAILAGKPERAAILLGRYWSIDETVLHGDQRGRTLGFPTANMALHEDRVAPRNGVYATVARYDGTLLKGVTNVGTNPTFTDVPTRVETYFPDFSADLYGKRFQLFFVAYLRPEEKFSEVAALVAQMHNDTERALYNLTEKLNIDMCR